MKIFISWSGERSKSLAFALKEWLPLVLHYVNPWLSEADIEAGQRWADAVAKELESCNFGILCITKENLSSPWVLFEAGALAKSLEGSRVIPLLLDLDFKEISGPLAQFQAKKLEKTGLIETIQAINQNSSSPVPDDRYKQLFEALWPDLERKIAQIPKSSSPSKQVRSQPEILEELVGAVRTMESRLRDIPDTSEERHSLRRKSKMYPLMIREFSSMIGDRDDDPIILAMIASLFQSDIPWLYEIGMESYRAASSESREDAKRAVTRFFRAIELIQNSPFLHEFGIETKAFHPHVLKEIDILLREGRFWRKRYLRNTDNSTEQPA